MKEIRVTLFPSPGRPSSPKALRIKDPYNAAAATLGLNGGASEGSPNAIFVINSAIRRELPRGATIAWASRIT